MKLPAAPGGPAVLGEREQGLALRWGKNHPARLQLAASFLCVALQENKSTRWAKKRFNEQEALHALAKRSTLVQRLKNHSAMNPDVQDKRLSVFLKTFLIIAAAAVGILIIFGVLPLDKLLTLLKLG